MYLIIGPWTSKIPKTYLKKKEKCFKCDKKFRLKKFLKKWTAIPIVEGQSLIFKGYWSFIKKFYRILTIFSVTICFQYLNVNYSLSIMNRSTFTPKWNFQYFCNNASKPAPIKCWVNWNCVQIKTPFNVIVEYV